MKNETPKIAQQLTIPDEMNGQRLDQAVAKLLPEYSRVLIQKWIKAGNLLLNQKIAKPRAEVCSGDTIDLEAELEVKADWAAQSIPLNIIYEDEALLVLNKPIGLVVHPGSGNPDSTLLNALLFHAPGLKHLPRAGIVHRLDKNTSGLLVIAKTLKAYNSLNSQLRKRTLRREYQAIVSGLIISGGTVDAPLARNPLQRKRMAVVETGKMAVTHYRVAEKYRAHTRLKLRLETGRTHQIRVHMAYIQHPIIGDVTYGERLRLPKNATPALVEALRQFKHQALHAEELGLVHPDTGKEMHWKVELPEDFKRLISCLREDTLLYNQKHSEY